MADFDLQGALKAGYSLTEINDYLGQASEFDVAGARKAGYADDEILKHLMPAPPPDEPPAKRTVLGTLGDAGVAAAKTVVGTGEALMGAADLVTLGRAGKLAESAGVDFKRTQGILSDLYSPAQKEASAKVEAAKGFVPTLQASIENPSTIVQTVGESLGPMLLGGGVGGLARTVAPKLAGWAAGAIGEGAVGAASSAESIRQANPDGVLTPGQTGAALASGLGTGALGAIGGKIANRFGFADVDTMLAQGGSAATNKGIVRRIIEGGVSEGVFEELPQSAQEQVWQNAALGRPLMDGVPEASAKGLLAGTAMGGGANILAKPTPADIAAAPDTDTAVATFAAATAPEQPMDSSIAGFIDTAQRDAAQANTAYDQLLTQDPARQLTNQAGPALVAGDLGVGTPAQMEQARMDGMRQPAAVVDNTAQVAAAQASNQTNLATVQSEETPTAPLHQVKTIAGQPAASHTDADLAQMLANRATPAITKMAIVTEQQTRANKPTTATGTGGTNAITSSMGGTTISVNPTPAAKTPTVAQAEQILRTPYEKRLPAAPEQLRLVRERIGATAFAQVEQLVNGPALLTKEQQAETRRFIYNDGRTAPVAKAQPATLDTNVAQQQLADNEEGRFSPNRVADEINALEPTFPNLETETNAPQATKAAMPPVQEKAQPIAGVPVTDQGLTDALGPINEVTEADLKSEAQAPNSKRMSSTRAAVIRTISRMFGKKVRFYSSDKLVADGVTVKDNEVWINIDSGVDGLAVAGHEWRHTIKNLGDGKYHAAIQTATRKLLEASPGRLQEFAQGYLAKSDNAEHKAMYERSQANELTEEDKDYLAEEFSADITGNMWRDPEALRQVFDAIMDSYPPSTARNLIKTIGDAIIRMVNKLLLSPKASFSELGISRPELVALKSEIQAAMKESFMQSLKGRQPGQGMAARTSTAKKESVHDHRMKIERQARKVAADVVLSDNEEAAIIKSATDSGLSLHDIRAKVIEVKKQFPTDGVGEDRWAPIEFQKIDMPTFNKKKTDDKPFPSDAVFFKQITYNFHTSGDVTESERINQTADALANEIKSYHKLFKKKNPIGELVIRQRDWYRALHGKLRSSFGGFGDFLAQLLGPTSANTPVGPNWAMGIEALQKATSGEWDGIIKSTVEWRDGMLTAAENLSEYESDLSPETKKQIKGVLDKVQAKFGKGKHPDKAGYTMELVAEIDPRLAELRMALEDSTIYKGEIPRKSNGTQFGMATDGILRILHDGWSDKKPGDAPKTKNYYQNIVGRTWKATIDVWAARTLRRLTDNLYGDRPRIPTVAETGVQGTVLADGVLSGSEFGFGQEVFELAAETLRKSGIKEFKSTTAADVQAMIWFGEKEKWAREDWTSKIGEEGSIEQQLLMAGHPDRERVRKLTVAARKGAPNIETKPYAPGAKNVKFKNKAGKTERRPETPKEIVARHKADVAAWKIATKQAHDELESLQRTPDYWTAGFTTELDSSPLGRAQGSELAQASREIEDAALSQPNVMAIKAKSSEGVFGKTYENTIDFEMVTLNDYNPVPLITKLITKAKETGQMATFLSRRVRDDESIDPLFHRPGVEIYFRKEIPKHREMQIIKLINSMGFDGMTFQVDPIRTPEALSGKTGAKIGLRLQWVPEFDGSVSKDSDVGDLLSTWVAKTRAMDKLVVQLSKESDVAIAQRSFYETHVYDWTSYDQELAQLRAGQKLQQEGDAGENAGMVGGRQWRGQPIGRAFEISDRVFGDDSSRDEARSGLMERRDQAQGLTGFARFSPARSDAGSDNDYRGGAEGSSQRPSYGKAIDSHAINATGVHYSKEQRGSLSSAFFGTGMKGEERERVAGASDPRIKRRLYFYVSTGKGVAPESDVGTHAHTVDLNNLYDMDADPLDLVQRLDPLKDARDQKSEYQRMNESESAIIDAGYDGFITRTFGKGGAAVLLGDHSVPVQYEGQVNPETAPVKEATLTGWLAQHKAVADNKSLPTGSMKGADWKRMMPKLMPEIDVSHLPDDKWLYKDQIVKRPDYLGLGKQDTEVAKFSPFRAVDTESAEFKKWFGKSAVVDADGKPLVVYHGTNNDFDAFDPNEDLGGLIFTSASPKEAGVFAYANGANLMPVYLKAEKVWPKIVRSYDEAKSAAKAKKMGYDAIRVRDDDSGEINYAVFSPTQIKSATSNTGEFSDTNPDIRYSPARDRANIDTALRRMDKFVTEFEKGGVKDEDSQLLGSTPVVLRAIGAKDLPLEIGGAVLSKVLAGKHRHFITAGMMRQLPEGLYNPLMVFFQEEGGALMLTDLKATSGNPVVTAVHFSSTAGRMKVNRIASAFEYDRMVERFSKRLGDLKYVRNDKDLADSTKPGQLDLPDLVQKARGLGHTILTEADLVKSYGPMFSPPRSAQPFDIANETSMEKFRRQQQDAVIRWESVQEQIKKQGGKVGVFEDVYAAMKRYAGRVGEGITRFTRDYVEPLMERVAKQKTNLEEIGTYLYALHAKDRNAYIASIRDDMSDNGSGMSNAEADQVIADYRKRADFKEFDQLARDFQGLTQIKLDMLRDYGVIDQDQIDAMNKAMGAMYIPLKGFEKVDENGERAQGNGAGTGYSTNKKLDKKAYGRVSKAGNIVENIVRDFERAILAGEKANVGQRVRAIVKSNPDNTLWTIDYPAKQPTLRNGQVVLMPKQFDAENEIQFIENGKAIRIQVHDELLSRAYNNLGAEQLHSFLQASATLNSYLRQFWTQKNPAFFLINPIRDVQTATMTNTGEEGFAFALKALGNLRKAFKLSYAYERNNMVGMTADEKEMLRLYGNMGSRTGAAFIDTIEAKALKLQEVLNRKGGMTLREEWRHYGAASASKLAFFKIFNNGFFDFIEHLNGGFENMTRMATFMAYIEQEGGLKNLSGAKKAEVLSRAGKLAKNVTVDFNTRGELGKDLNALYLFWNAAVQGTTNVVKSMTTAKHKQQVWTAIGGLITAGLMLSLMGDDDDDDLTPDNVKERNLVFHINGMRYQLPMAYGYSAFVDLGRLIGDVAKGRKDTLKASMHMTSSLLANFNPLGDFFHSGKGEWQDAFLSLVPTVLKPGAMTAANRGPFGNKVMPEYPGQENNPDRTKMWRSTRGSVYDKIANEMMPWVDVSPETLKLWTGYVVGGAGRTISDGFGASLNGMAGEFDVEKTPILSKFVATNDVEEYRGRFYEQLQEAEKYNAKVHWLDRELKRAEGSKKIRLMEDKLVLQKERAKEIAFAKNGVIHKKTMKSLADQEHDARAADKMDEVKVLEQKQIDLAKRINEKWKSLYKTN